MEKRRLEARALELVALVERGSGVEDNWIELKSQWPTDHYKAARQLAGLANASRGASVLWIIGLDEEEGVVDTLEAVEVSDWWAQVARLFDEQPPKLQHLTVPTGHGKHVVALRFDTESAPYLVNVPGGGRIEREVPWREGGSTRTAHRHELLNAVVARAEVPELELVSGTLAIKGVDPYEGSGEDDVPPRVLELNAAVFVSAVGPSTLPQHRQEWAIEVDGHPPRSSLDVRIRGPLALNPTAAPEAPQHRDVRIIDVIGDCGLSIYGSAEVRVTGRAYCSREEAEEWKAVPWIDLRASLPLDRSNLVATLRARFVPSSSLGIPDWDPVTGGAVPEFRALV